MRKITDTLPKYYIYYNLTDVPKDFKPGNCYQCPLCEVHHGIDGGYICKLKVEKCFYNKTCEQGKCPIKEHHYTKSNLPVGQVVYEEK